MAAMSAPARIRPSKERARHSGLHRRRRFLEGSSSKVQRKRSATNHTCVLYYSSSLVLKWIENLASVLFSGIQWSRQVEW